MKLQCNKGEKSLAEEFDRLDAASKNVETPAAPPGEFDAILSEMERRGIYPRVRKELDDRK